MIPQVVYSNISVIFSFYFYVFVEEEGHQTEPKAPAQDTDRVVMDSPGESAIDGEDEMETEQQRLLSEPVVRIEIVSNSDIEDASSGSQPLRVVSSQGMSAEDSKKKLQRTAVRADKNNKKQTLQGTLNQSRNMKRQKI